MSEPMISSIEVLMHEYALYENACSKDGKKAKGLWKFMITSIAEK